MQWIKTLYPEFPYLYASWLEASIPVYGTEIIGHTEGSTAEVDDMPDVFIST